MSDFLSRAAARLLFASSLVERSVRKFESLRTHLVLAFGSERFLEIYSQEAFGKIRAYNPDFASFRRGLFSWETEAVQRFFPPPPARILVGGAGGGRETLALAEQGYQVVAFDPAAPLLESLIQHAKQQYPASIEARVASYEDLPVLPATGDLPALDLRAQPPFDAVIFGWTSLSHVPTTEKRRDALEKCLKLTRGPILVSFFYQARYDAAKHTSGFLARRAARWGPSMWAPNTGYARLFSDEDVKELAESAGLEVVFLEREKAWPHAVLRAQAGIELKKSS